MISLFSITTLLCVRLHLSFAESALESDATYNPDFRRFARTYDKNFKFPKTSYSDAAIDEDNYEPVANDNFKGYPPISYPGFRPNYKRYPFYPPSKGPFRFPEVAGQDDNSAAMINPWTIALGKIPEKKDEKGGFLSNLMSDLFVTAALVPLSVMLASFLPVLMNSLMTGMPSGTQVVTTTAANGKEARSLHGASYGKIMEHFGKFSRAMDDGDCFEKAICRTMSGESREHGSESVKKAASFVASLVKYGWINNIDVKVILEGLNNDNCDDLCNSKISSATP